MALSEIVNLQIQAGTVNPARRGFGTPFLLMSHSVWTTPQVRTYTSFAGVAADFPATSLPYLHAQAIFSQPRRPQKIKIGRLPAPATSHVQVLDFAAHPSASAIVGSVVSPAGVETAINVAWNTNIATTLAALDTAIEAALGVGTVAVASPVITVTTTTAGPHGGIARLEFATAAIRETTADWDYDDSLTAHALLDGDFYGVIIDSNSPKNIDKAARWCLANDRLLIVGPQYSDPTDFVSGEFTSGSDYTALLANNAAVGIFTRASRESAIESAWTGLLFSYQPGQATWAYKQLAGVGADTYSATDRTNIEAVHANHYTSEAAIGVTRPGKAFGGEWVDVVIGLAWLDARLQEDLFALLVSESKIPYTDEGIAQIESTVRGVLREAERNKVIDSGWTITKTSAAEQSLANRSARRYGGLEFQARLSGAIHFLDPITGTVTA